MTLSFGVGQPNNVNGDQDCVRFRISKGGNDDYSCSQAYCPLCKMSLNAKFHLQGVCLDSPADSFYLLRPGGWFEGFIQSRLVFSAARGLWEILDSRDEGVVARLNHTGDYPLGQHAWYFPARPGSPPCTDPQSEERRLNLHLAVEQPGQFCCEAEWNTEQQLRLQSPRSSVFVCLEATLVP